MDHKRNGNLEFSSSDRAKRNQNACSKNMRKTSKDAADNGKQTNNSKPQAVTGVLKAVPDLQKYEFCAKQLSDRKYFLIYGSFPSGVVVESGLNAVDKCGKTVVYTVKKNSCFSPFIEPGDQVVAMNEQLVTSAQLLTSLFRNKRGYFEMITLRPGLRVSDVVFSNLPGKLPVYGKFVFHRTLSTKEQCDQRFKPSIVCRELIVADVDKATVVDKSTTDNQVKDGVCSKRECSNENLKTNSDSTVGWNSAATTLHRKLESLRKGPKVQNNTFNKKKRYVRVTMKELHMKQMILLEHIHWISIPQDIVNEMEKMIFFLPEQLKAADQINKQNNETVGKTVKVRRRTKISPYIERRIIPSDVVGQPRLKKKKNP